MNTNTNRNFYLLEQIFSFNNLKDQLNISSTCRNYKKISDKLYYKNWEEILINNFIGDNIYNIFSTKEKEMII
jgi:hypothetical protein